MLATAAHLTQLFLPASHYRPIATAGSKQQMMKAMLNTSSSQLVYGLDSVHSCTSGTNGKDASLIDTGGTYSLCVCDEQRGGQMVCSLHIKV